MTEPIRTEPTPTIVEEASLAPSDLNILDRLVSGPRLLELLWEKASRPSIRWLRQETALRRIPTVRSRGRTWFVPRQVLESMSAPEVRRGRPRSRQMRTPVY